MLGERTVTTTYFQVLVKIYKGLNTILPYIYNKHSSNWATFVGHSPGFIFIISQWSGDPQCTTWYTVLFVWNIEYEINWCFHVKIMLSRKLQTLMCSIFFLQINVIGQHVLITCDTSESFVKVYEHLVNWMWLEFTSIH